MACFTARTKSFFRRFKLVAPTLLTWFDCDVLNKIETLRAANHRPSLFTRRFRIPSRLRVMLCFEVWRQALVRVEVKPAFFAMHRHDCLRISSPAMCLWFAHSTSGWHRSSRSCRVSFANRAARSRTHLLSRERSVSLRLHTSPRPHLLFATETIFVLMATMVLSKKFVD